MAGAVAHRPYVFSGRFDQVVVQGKEGGEVQIDRSKT
jgi:hypothetical protein